MHSCSREKKATEYKIWRIKMKGNEILKVQYQKKKHVAGNKITI